MCENSLLGTAILCAFSATPLILHEQIAIIIKKTFQVLEFNGAKNNYQYLNWKSEATPH